MTQQFHSKGFTKRNANVSKTYRMFLEALFTIAKNEKQKGSSKGEGINKLQYNHTMEYYPAAKREQTIDACNKVDWSKK